MVQQLRLAGPHHSENVGNGGTTAVNGYPHCENGGTAPASGTLASIVEIEEFKGGGGGCAS